MQTTQMVGKSLHLILISINQYMLLSVLTLSLTALTFGFNEQSLPGNKAARFSTKKKTPKGLSFKA